MRRNAWKPWYEAQLHEAGGLVTAVSPKAASPMELLGAVRSLVDAFHRRIQFPINGEYDIAVLAVNIQGVIEDAHGGLIEPPCTQVQWVEAVVREYCQNTLASLSKQGG